MYLTPFTFLGIVLYATCIYLRIFCRVDRIVYQS